MFSSEGYKADFELNCKVLTAKSLIFKEIVKFSFTNISRNMVNYQLSDMYVLPELC